ncbi:hypothetical protein A3D11_03520 [Candidatus Peribacteria bacterium RIFCSPHIGHO2_02_FULL_49_16]|nr:MAG: hypothetical protein A2880_04480 [Candidatus Peribacteria bacterium RIFCSPHIGHO2_01_FULL_49_38]OGJ58804.1 MAG: hypothetical protein A3D11_03520 [Candidatus Peribacteria bacterium RIFCSPHIGHO2_02_FULL_49_16]
MFERYQKALQNNRSITFTVRVRPHAAHSRITGILDDGSVKIDLATAAENGRANRELINLLSIECGVARENIEILSGKKERRKFMRVRRT